MVHIVQFGNPEAEQIYFLVLKLSGYTKFSYFCIGCLSVSISEEKYGNTN